MREQEKAWELEAELTLKSSAAEHPSFSLEVVCRQAAERRGEYRRLSAEERRAHDLEREQERSRERRLDGSQELDDPGIE